MKWVGMVLSVAFVSIMACRGPSESLEVTSPNGSIQVSFMLNDGAPVYDIGYGGESIIDPSRLGFLIKDASDLSNDLLNVTANDFLNNFLNNFVIESSSSREIDETWTQPWGEKTEIRNHYRELRIQLKESSGPPRKLDIVFRVFNDGVGFRYEIPEQPAFEDLQILDEKTEFAMAGDYTAWWIPAYKEQRYEYLYQATPISEMDTVHTPVTFKTGSGLYVSIHEAALTDYSSMALARTGDHALEVDLFPWSDGIKVRGRAPMKTPWRTIQIAETPGDLISSYLILNLNEPNVLGDVSWVKPGKYVGIWWEMHLATSTWGSGPNHGATTKNAKRYIDFAAAYGFDGVLVEGWNVGWDGNWIENGDLFRFTEAYDDFDIEAVAKYAMDKGVRLIGHHETGVGVDNYEAQMNETFAMYENLGVKAVKTGYVGFGQGIRRVDETGEDQYEWHHGQYMVRHYRSVVEEAARHHIMIDAHEPIKATGIRRTYPNMMTREGARGQEYNAWGEDGGNPPDHTTIIPFTRLLGGPMDFTPGIFDLTFEEEQANNRVNTTLAKQLALYVVIYSPLQMAADLPEKYEERPDAFEFIVDVPTDWEDTRVLGAEIGDYVTIVRKDRHSEDWYLGSITDENARTLEVALDFLDSGKTYLAEIYGDGDDADWETNPYSFVTSTQEVGAGQALILQLAAGGGQAIRFTPVH